MTRWVFSRTSGARTAAQQPRNPQSSDRVWFCGRVKIAVRFSLVSASLLLKLPFSPDRVDGGIHEQFENEGCADATDHRSRDSLHDFGARTGRPWNRNE